MLPYLPLALLLGCPQDIRVTKQRIDNDGDGYSDQVDCDDARADVNPEAEEVCDGIDNDCDGTVDVGASDASRYYADVDADNHGNPAAPADLCAGTPGYVELGDDCDDADPTAFPGNPEVCDGVDNDCNGDVDDNAAEATPYYEDGDGDGYGDPGVSVDACEAPPGYVASSTDCDDTNGAVHPGADESDCTDPVDYNCDGSVGYADADGDGAPACTDCDDSDSGRSPLLAEVCDDLNVDEDCDGLADDDDDSVDPTTLSTWYRDVDLDGYSDGTGLTVLQCDPPTAAYTTLLGDCDDYDPRVNPGMLEVCDPEDLDEDCDGLSDDSDPSTDPASFLTYYGDLDADGYGEGARAAAQCEAPAGYVLDGTDCDDTDAGRNPGAQEVCDSASTDEDCDGLADDADPSAIGQSTFYIDGDRDGYGGPSPTASACVAPAGYAATGDDCDDSNGAVNPGEAEVCDAFDVDDDCNGTADDHDPGVAAAGKVDFYFDGDADGYGAGAALPLCDPVPGYVESSNDCDDSDADTFPGSALSEDPTLCTRDADGDGYGDSAVSAPVDAGTDCDDTDPLVSPAGTEDCATAYDDDCDGSLNARGATGCVAYFADADLDDYGLATDSACYCAPEGDYRVFAPADTDCDDTNASINPGATEVCDAADVDEDCDGLADDADPDVASSSKSSFYADSDGDGFGAAASASKRCDAAVGVVSDASDCDDSDAEAYPGAAPLDSATACMQDDDLDDYGDETPTGGTSGTDCDDAVTTVNPGVAETCLTPDDDDCDGSANDIDALACTDFYIDLDLDGYGAGAGQCTCSADTVYTSSASTDCDDAASAVNPAALEICGDGADNDCDGVADDGCPTYAYHGTYLAEDGASTDADAVYYGTAGSDAFGSVLATGMDFNGDGADDLAVGASGETYAGLYEGVVYVYDGFPTASASAATDATGLLYGSTSASYTWGAALWGVQDFDSDGVDELAVARSDSTTTYVYLYEGTSLAATSDYSSSSVYYDRVAANGPVSGIGDEGSTYGDNEIAIANPATGAVSLYSHGAGGLTSLYVINQEASLDQAGHGLAGGEGNDPNGDGYDDLFIGAYGQDSGASGAGAVYVVEAPITATFSLADAALKIPGTTSSEYFGWAVGAPGDVNGDGQPDMVVTAPRDDDGSYNAGAVYLFEGINPEAGTPDSATSDYAVKIIGANNSDNLGSAQPALGDVNGDGELDIFVGAPNWDNGSASSAGAAWLIYGPLSGVYDLASADGYDATFTGDGSSDACGSSVGIGDLNADGAADMMMGCSKGDYSGRPDAGTVYFFAGG